MARPNNDDRVLSTMPATKAEIMNRIGIPSRTLYEVIKRLHGSGKIHINGWKRTPGGGPFSPIYMEGEGKDVYCQLQPMDQSQIWRRHKRKMMATGEWEDKAAIKRARWHANKAAKSKVKAHFASTLFSLAGIKSEVRT